ncbi:type III pantothenate kinase [Pseudomonas stutzeri]|uniref:type III pantothenate kinase n=1 Tax=Stutzerimonas stutzeri TaxID=316 RepID=UPI0021089B9C|nr:type III pantothenate kinase [Stutzerimonas stutzeri]MCQ4289584.1 type III pantothenate kinase [Stutzerimonas stutzeri]
MILELDCGNSFIKWRVIPVTGGMPLIQGIASQPVDIVQALLGQGLSKIPRCRLVSVRSDAETQVVMDVLSESLSLSVTKACPAERLAGVVNGYRDQQRLGLDRWLAIVAAYDMCGEACLVIDLGTAITVDLVARDGTHLGGYIAPGVALLRGRLLAHTRRIQYDSEGAALVLSDFSPGRSTAEAVDRGCLTMARSYVSSQIAFAESYLGSDFVTYVTGGDAPLVADVREVRCVADLVFRGLALACP